MKRQPVERLERGDWIVARRPAPMTIGTGKNVYRPDLLLVMHAPSGLALATDVMEPGGEPADIARRLDALIRNGPRLKLPVDVPPPARLCLEDAALASALRNVMGKALPVVVRPIPEIDPLFESLEAFAERVPPEDAAPPPAAADVDRATLAAFFAAADRVYAHAPWERASDSQILSADASGFDWGKSACLSIIGALGESRGLLLFRSFEDYRRFPEQAGPAQAAGRPTVIDAPLFAINFDVRRDAPKEYVQQAKAARVSSRDSGGFPWIQHFGARTVSLDLDAGDYVFATALLEALASLLDRHPDVFESALDLPVRTGGPRSARTVVKLQAPHPEMPWDWGEDPIRFYRWTTVEELQDDFFRSMRPTPPEREAYAHAIQCVMGYKIDARNEDVLDWTPADLEDYLLEYFPKKEHVPDSEIERVPDRLWAFFQYLGSSGHGDPEAMRQAANTVTRHREEFVRRARDRTRFGPAKTLVIAMQSEGVDPTDKKAVARFMADFNARVAKDPDLLPLADMPARKKWTWQPGDPAPDAAGLCPCGSGRRYKKCCRPR
jgi:hypothetical protein